ncbi:unnamed protein product, partial [Cyprideis torosa]
AVRWLLDEFGADVNDKDFEGWTPLHYACAEGRVLIVSSLLRRGALLEAKDSEGWTPLHFASSQDNAITLRLLLHKGANVAVTDGGGWSPLHVAAHRGHSSSVACLLEMGAPIDATEKEAKWRPLHYACSNGHLECADLLLGAGAEIDAPMREGQRPLHLCILGGRRELLLLLLKRGARVSSKDETGRTPLHWACFNGETSMALDLVSHGADVNDGDRTGETPLMAASIAGHEATVGYLVQHAGADVNQEDVIQQTALLHAAREDHTAIMKILLEAGANVDARDSLNGFTPLFWACRQDALTSAKFLIEHGANWKLTDNYGVSAVWHAVRRGDSSLLQYFVDLCGTEYIDGLKQIHRIFPDRLNNEFIVIDQISEGSFGIVHKAFKNGKVYAVKEFKHALKPISTEGEMEEEEEAEAWEKETSAMSMGTLTPFVAGIVSVWVQKVKMQSLFFIQMELCWSDLEQWMNKTKPQDRKRRRVLRFLCDCSSGLRYFRDTMKKIHRDIKPANVLLRKETDNEGITRLVAKIADLGLATDRLNPKGEFYFERSQGGGAGAYLAPEIREIVLKTRNNPVVDGVPKYDEKVDIYALGGVFFDLLLLEPAAYHTRCRWRSYDNFEAKFPDYFPVIRRMLGGKMEKHQRPLAYEVEDEAHRWLQECLPKENSQVSELEDSDDEAVRKWESEIEAEIKKIEEMEKNPRKMKLKTKPQQIIQTKTKKQIQKQSVNPEEKIRKAANEAQKQRLKKTFHQKWSLRLLRLSLMLFLAVFLDAVFNRCSTMDRQLQATEEVRVMQRVLRTVNPSACTAEFFAASVFGDLESMKSLSLQTEKRLLTAPAAACGGHYFVLRWLLDDFGAAINESDSAQWTALHYASALGRPLVVNLLLKRGADVHARSDTGATPLLYATIENHAKTLELLRRAGAALEVEDVKGLSPMHYAASLGHTSCLAFLLEDKAPVDAAEKKNSWVPLHYACWNGHLKCAELLVNAGANVSVCDGESNTPFLLAARQNHPAILRLLASKGADTTVTNDIGLSAVHMAAMLGHESALTCLIDLGAPLDVAEKTSQLVQNKFVPFHYACVESQLGCAKILLQAGIDINARDRMGRTALHLSSYKGLESSVQLLLDRRALVDCKDETGSTPLYFACSTGHVSVAQELVCNGADINARNRIGMTPLMKASQAGHEKTVWYLVHMAKAEKEERNIFGLTALSCAAMTEHTSVIRILLDAGAAINTRNIQGSTPLEMACLSGSLRTVKLLMDHDADWSSTNVFGVNSVWYGAGLGPPDVKKYFIDRFGIEHIQKVLKENRSFPDRFPGSDRFPDPEFYDIVDIGEGSFGKVSKAKKGDKAFAVKEIVLESSSTSELTEQERRERWKDIRLTWLKEVNAMFGGALTIFVTGMIEFWRQDKTEKVSMFISMELCECSLHDWMSRRKPGKRKKNKVLRFLCDLASGLRFLHFTVKMIHRDIKPENVLLREETDYNGTQRLVAKIADLGLATDRYNSKGEVYFKRSQGGGQGVYLAPEIKEIALKTEKTPVREDVPKYDEKIDIYSMGAVFFDLIFLKPAAGHSDCRWTLYTKFKSKFPDYFPVINRMLEGKENKHERPPAYEVEDEAYRWLHEWLQTPESRTEDDRESELEDEENDDETKREEEDNRERKKMAAPEMTAYEKLMKREAMKEEQRKLKEMEAMKEEQRKRRDIRKWRHLK